MRLLLKVWVCDGGAFRGLDRACRAQRAPLIPCLTPPPGRGPGTGRIDMPGSDLDDVCGIQDAVHTANFFLRLHADDACKWAGQQAPGADEILREKRDLLLKLIPSIDIRAGGSCGLGLVVALLRVYLGCRIKPRVVIIGGVSLSGEVRGVQGLVPKVKAAVAFGANLVVAPKENELEAKSSLSAAMLKKVVFIEKVTQVFPLTIEGRTEAVVGERRDPNGLF